MKTRAEYRQLMPGRVNVFFFIHCLGLLIVTSSLSGQPYDPYTKLTDDNFTQSEQAMDGDYIVFKRTNIAKDNGLFLYHIPSGDITTIFTCDHTNIYSVDISGDRIVWQQYVDNEWDIYTYLISRPDIGPYPLIDYADGQVSPAIDGNRLVYIDYQGGEFSSNVYLYDMDDASVTQITTDDDLQQHHPDIYGNYIVYYDGRNGNDDIFMYDIYNEEEIQITDDEADQRNPKIWGRRIVWEDKRNGNWDIYMHYINFYPDTDPVKANWPVFTGNGIGYVNYMDQKSPSVYKDYIVFQDNRNYNWDVFLYTFINPICGTTQPIIEEVRGQIDPIVYENKVVWADEREYTGSGWSFNNLWMWIKPPGADLTVNIEDDPDPAALNTELTYRIFVSNLGDQNAYDIDFVNTLPAGMEFVSMDGFGSGGYSQAGNVISCVLDSLVARDTDTVTIVVNTMSEGIFTNTASVSSDEEDADPGNNTSSCTTRVIWKIPNRVGTGAVPSVAVDAYGRAHFCYLSQEYGGKLIYAYSQGKSFVEEIVDSGEDNFSPDLAIDKNNNIHIAYGKGDGWDNNVLMYVTKTAGEWSTPETVAENMGSSKSICIRTGSDNSLHISCMTSQWPNGSLFYFRKNGSWSSELVKMGAYNSSSFDLDSSNHAHFVYYDLTSYGLCYKTNSPNGSWQSEEPPFAAWYGGQMESLVTDIALDSNSNPHVSYVASTDDWGIEDYRYALKTGGTWQHTLIADGAFSGGPNYIDTDPGNHAHICYVDLQDSKLVYTTNNEGLWKRWTIDYYPDWGLSSDVCTDRTGHVHIVYSKENKVYYVTNTVPLPEPVISVKPQLLDFHGRVLNDTTDAKTVVISNNGDANLVISDIRIVWRDSSNFSISRSSCDVIAPGDTCSVDVKFNPVSMGNKHAMLWITCNDPGNPEEGVSLKGIGLEGFLWDYGPQSFGEVYLGDSAVNEYKLKNMGNDNLVVQGIFIQEGDAADFYCTGLPEVPFAIDEGDSIVYEMVFKPSEKGERNTVKRIYSTGGDRTHELSGIGLAREYDISGEVRLPDNSLVNQGWIFAVNMGDDNPFYPYYYLPLEGATSFTIQNVPEMSVTMRFDPDLSANPGFVRTYLGNTPFIEDAEIFYHNSEKTGIQLVLVEAPLPGSGSGNASGQLVEEEDGGKKAVLQVKTGKYQGTGTPLDSVPVYLLGPDGAIEHADVTDEMGEFNFMDISTGSYLFKVDYEGCVMDEENDTLRVTEENQNFEIIAIVSDGMVSCSMNELTGINEVREDLRINAFPNPFSNEIQIMIHAPEPGEIEFELFDLSGRTVVMDRRSIAGGNFAETIRLETIHLEPGCYVLKIRSQNDLYVRQLLKAN